MIKRFLVISFAVVFSFTSVSLADDSAKASYKFTNKQKDLKSADARLKALEKALLKQLDSEEEPKVIEKPVVKKAAPKAAVTYTDSNKLHKQNLALKAKLAKQEKSMRTLKAKLEQSHSPEDLEKLAKSLRAELLLAEAEIERLSSIIEDDNQKMLKINSKPNPIKTTKEAQTRNITYDQADKTSEDMPILTVTALKANLRAGPSLQHSPLMEVGKGTRLVMEKRLGNWYRVISPHGNRAWISSTVIAFGENKDSSPTRTLSVKGYSQSVNNESLGLRTKPF